MEGISAIEMQSGYREGYAKGFSEGYNRAIEQFQKVLLQGPPPRIIVTTKEKLEEIKKQYNID